MLAEFSAFLVFRSRKLSAVDANVPTDHSELPAFLTCFSETWTETAKSPNPFPGVGQHLFANFLDHKLGTSLKLFLILAQLPKVAFCPQSHNYQVLTKGLISYQTPGKGQIALSVYLCSKINRTTTHDHHGWQLYQL